jgi:hypothetical protein
VLTDLVFICISNSEVGLELKITVS